MAAALKALNKDYPKGTDDTTQLVIKSQLVGLNIKYWVGEDCTVENTIDKICRLTSLPENTWYMWIDGKAVTLSDHYRRIREWASLGTVTIYMVPKFGGGAAKSKPAKQSNVRTTLFKKKVDQTTSDGDKKAFELAFEGAIRAMAIKQINVREMLNGMSLSSLRDIEDLLSSKANNDYKLMGIGDHTKECMAMKPVAEKLVFAMDSLKNIVGAAVAEYFGEADGVNMEDVRAMIKVILKEKSRDDQMTG